MTRIYANPNTAEVGKYFEAAKARLADGAKSTRDVFDSIDNDHSVKTPTALAGVFEKLNDNFHKDVFDSVLCGMDAYRQNHGCDAPADVIEQALHNAKISQMGLKDLNIRLDSATESHMDAYSLQPNRATVSILSAMAEAIPFAGYFPADIRSNEARSLILKNRATKDWGGYGNGGSLDGVANGDPYIMPNRLLA